MSSDLEPHATRWPPRGSDLPSSDGEPMETARHRLQMNVLIDTLADAWAARDDFYVGGNMFVYFSELHAKTFRGPDVFVVLDTIKHSRDKWYAWEEGGKLPDVVIELLSPSTREIDRGEKKRIYERVWKLATYVMYDPFSHELEVLTPSDDGTFTPVPEDARGDFAVAPTGLSIGLRDGDIHEEKGPFLRWIDADGAPLPLGRERAEDAEQRLAEAERARTEAECARTDAERARMDAEQRAADAERRIAALEAAHAKRGG
ncbi:MAG: Uma2 family endonuclease [Deltaproteobacteria bacterium]|nr:Uma2 family endonuclease [Deltaproteobacteria bacterium]